MHRRYEMVLVADPTVPEPSHDEQITQIENLISERGGLVHKIDRWGRMKLAYSIKSFNEGNYTLMLFDGEPAVEKELLRRLRISDTFIRFLSMRADHEKAPTEEERGALAEKRVEQLRRAAEREAELAARAAAPEPGAEAAEASGGEAEASGEATSADSPAASADGPEAAAGSSEAPEGSPEAEASDSKKAAGSDEEE